MDMQQNVDGISSDQSDYGFVGSVETEPYSDSSIYLDAANVSPAQSSDTPHQNSQPYYETEPYSDSSIYLDTANVSPSQSLDTPYQNSQPYFQDYIASDVYPSPEIEAESPMSEIYQQHHAELEQVMSDPRVKEEPGHLAGSMVDATPPATSSSKETATPAAKPPAKRKRENRYKNAPPSVLIRRRAQNRASQRAYRERKDQRIKDLEQLLEESQKKSAHLSSLLQASHNELIRFRMNAATAPKTAADLNPVHIQTHIQSQHQQHQQQLQQLQQFQQQQQHLQMRAHPHHHRHSSSAASQVSHLSQLSATSTMATAVSSSGAPTPISSASIVTGFDPAAAGTMAVAAHPDEMKYLYAQMGATYTI